MDLNDYQEGKILLIDKPLTWTSFDVVKKLRYAIKVKKIGHAGTLDPLATGLLLIGTGKFTKKLHELQGLDKTYTGVIRIGKTTPSFDLETEFDSETTIDHITPEMIDLAVKSLSGMISQIPPAHSAVKVNGQRAYKKARKNEEVIIEPRQVEIKRFEVTKFINDEVHFEIDCTKGTYIRSIARDFGLHLGVGGHLAALRRTKIGAHDVAQALTLEVFIEQLPSRDEAN
ncbi:MAG: tRNA pseudouridine55 synthase [Marinoscillum sp.]|jgi:tRNA pseudouridine55 synthase